MVRRALLACLVLAAAACSGSTSPPTPAPAPAPNPAAWPTASDKHEGATRDDTVATASTITVGESQVRTLFPEGDVDFVKVLLTGGMEYELSANRLNANGDVALLLLDTDGTTRLGFNDDYLSLDSRLRFTAPATGTYYLEVQSAYSFIQGDRVGLAAYTLAVRSFVDADGDGWSTAFDCNDHGNAVHPRALDPAADGVDQDCDGMDSLDPAVPDHAEPDDTPATARAMAVAVADPHEYVFDTGLTTANARTIVGPANPDWFTLVVPARAAYDLGFRSSSGAQGNVQLTVYDSDATTVLRASGAMDYRLRNTTAAEKKFYLRYAVGSGTSFYVPFAIPLGQDADGDGYYTRDRDGVRDCNDADPGIHPGAAESATDTVDRNCNGVIGR